LALSTSISFNWVTGPEFRLTPAAQIVWATTNATSGGNDLVLVRDAAQTLAQRNAGNAQRFNLYGTYTDASNYRRLFLSSTTAGAFTIGVEGAGTGASGNTLTVGNDLKVPSLSTSSATLFNAPAGYHVFYDGQSVLGFVISHINYDPDTAVFINSSNNVLSPQGVFAFGNGTYWQSDVVLKRTSANTISVLRGNFSTPGNFVSGTTSITPASLTGSSGTSALDISQTWNTTGIPTLIKANVVDTASSSSSLLMDLQVGGSSRIAINKNSLITVSRSGNSAVIVDTQRGHCFGFPDGVASIAASSSFASGITIRDGGCTVGSGQGYHWNSAAGLSGGTPHASLMSDSANTLAQRNSTNAQTFRIYNTFTDASNYERGKLEWSSNVLRIGTEKAGTGSARALELQTDGTTRLTIDTSGKMLVNVASSFAHTHIKANSGAASLALEPATNNVSGVYFGGNSGDFSNSILRLGNSFDMQVTSNGALTFRTGSPATERLSISATGLFTIADALNIAVGTTTGTKIGTATTQKLGFYNATPVVQPTAVADATDAASVITQLNALLSRMRTLGLIAT
jgi:hypothetical protein